MKAGCLFALFLLLFSAGVFAGVAVDVNVYDDVVYLYLDKLHAAGLIKTWMPQQRPLSRTAVAKLAAEARQNAVERHPLDSIIRELEAEFPPRKEKVEFTPLDKASFFLTLTNQEEYARSISTGIGRTPDSLQPLLSYNNGDHFGKYASGYFSTVHKLTASEHFAAYLEPKFYVKQGEDDNGGAGLYRGYAKIGWGDLEIEAGRDDILWGPGENSLAFSGNARGLDMIKVSSPAPFRFPGVFRYAGAFRGTAFVAFLRDDFTPHGTKMGGWRLDYTPLPQLDLGFDHVVFMGGNGPHTNSPTAGEAVKYFIGFLGTAGHDEFSTNHLLGPDFTLRIPQAMGMELYGKLFFDDTRIERTVMLKYETIFLGGIYFPALRSLDRMSLRAEMNYVGPRSYVHGQYSDGYTLNNKFLGFDGGPDSWAGTLTGRYQFNFDEFVKLDIRYLRRSNDHYRGISREDGKNIGFIRDIDRPEEKNFILRVGGQKKLSPRINLFMEAGYSYRRNAEFVDGASASDFALRGGVIFRPSTK